MKQQIEAFNLWYSGLPSRERLLVLAASVIMATTLLYILVWEPVYQGLDQQQQKYESQRNVLAWMQSASTEVKLLKQSGARPATNSNLPVSLVIEMSATRSGLKSSLGKLESSGKEGARVKIDTVSFDQMLLWINTLQQQHGVTISSANIELADKPGMVSARLSFNRNQ